MTERHGAVTFKGDPMTLAGSGEVKVGEPAPDFELTANDMSKFKLSDHRGKVVIVATVPSLDTSVCNVMTKHFDEAARELSDDIVVLTVSGDLPFAQKRWCGENDAENVVTLSDYMSHSFQDAWGLRIKELGLVARSVTVVDRDGKVVYHELVQEVAEEPDYEKALDAARQAVG